MVPLVRHYRLHRLIHPPEEVRLVTHVPQFGAGRDDHPRLQINRRVNAVRQGRVLVSVLHHQRLRVRLALPFPVARLAAAPQLQPSLARLAAPRAL
jgi:hypothetical protein